MFCSSKKDPVYWLTKFLLFLACPFFSFFAFALLIMNISRSLFPFLLLRCATWRAAAIWVFRDVSTSDATWGFPLASQA